MDEGASFGSARLRAGHPRLFTALGTSIASVLKIYHDVPHIYPSEKKGGAGMMSTVFIYSCIVVVLARRKLSSGVFTCKVHRTCAALSIKISSIGYSIGKKRGASRARKLREA